MPRKRFVIIAAGVIFLAGAVATASAIRTRVLHNLFSGQTRTDSESREDYYKGVTYDLKEYEVPREGDTEKESVRWNESKLRINEGWSSDAVSGATKLARLKSPSVYREKWAPRFLTITYPEHDAVFPPNLCAPFIEWRDVNNDFWQVTITSGERQICRSLSDKRRWRIPDGAWREAIERGGCSIIIKGVTRERMFDRKDGDVHQSPRVDVRISKDPADNSIVYRLVAPPFVERKTPDMFARDIRKLTPTLFLSSHRQYCFNCHTFSEKSGSSGKLSLQARYVGMKKEMRGTYLAVFDIDSQTGVRTYLPFKIQMTTFMSWSPDGSRLVLSANQSIHPQSPIVYETQTISQPTSDIAVYDMKDNTVRLLPGASDPDLLELYPCWTPDGESIIFSSVPVAREYSEARFDLKIVPWNNGKGGEPKFIKGASKNGMSNFYARFSPDGKWMSFVTAAYGSLIKASSDIYVVSADFNSPPRRLQSNFQYAADSWHSWSSNSRWLAFASKRDDGVFARVYMTHIDENGNASKAVRLPLADPLVRKSFNIPEFVKDVPPIDPELLYNQVNINARSHELETPDTGKNESE